MLEQNLQNFYCKSIAALAMSLAVSFIVLLPLQQSAAQSTLNVWRSAGPRADIRTVIVDPFNPNIIYAGGYNGVFKSVDNGESWVSLNLGGASDLSVDQINPNTIYAANEGIYKSTDGGLNWINLNSPAASRVQVSPGDPNFIVAADGNNNVFVTNNGGASWETRPFTDPFDYGDAFEIDPQNPNNIYTGYVYGDFIYLRRSNNAGATWTDFWYPCNFVGCPPGAQLRSATSAFKVDPRDSNIVYASACNAFFCSVWSLFKSANGGANWMPQGDMFQSTAMAISPQSPGIIYAAKGYPSPGGEVFRSLDDGASWSAFNAGLSSQSINDLAFSRSGKFLHAATAAGIFSVRVRPNENSDFDGDGRSDISVFRPSDRVWYLNQSANGFSASQFGLSTDKITPADFDGDGRADIALFRDGTWYWLTSSSGNFNAVQFGLPGDIPVPADYTGDGRAEIAIYRNGKWWIQNLTNNQTQVVNFGLSGDKPVAADYDGDGRTDQAVYRNGEWHLNRSTQGYTVINFGFSTDKPVIGDYDGDGKTDLAVYRDGTWYLQQSSQGFAAFNWGISTDIPAPADYDGDGIADAAIFRDGVWWIRQSTSGVAVQQFGLTNDQPVPAAFLP